MNIKLSLLILTGMFLMSAANLNAQKQLNQADDPAFKKASAHVDRGNTFAKKNKYIKAEKEYKKAINIMPNHVWAYYNLSKVCLMQKKEDQAIKYLREAIRANPDVAVIHNDLGNLYEDQKKYDAAVLEYKEAIRADPSLVLS